MYRNSVNRTVALVFGIVYLLVGVLGFFWTGFDGWVDNEGDMLLGIFEVNPLHNIVHILIGLALIGAARAGHAAARGMNITIGAAYFIVFLYGLFVDKDSEANFLALNSADDVLHIVTALVLLGVAFFADKNYRDTTADTRV